ncbi:MAG: cell wall metabolism sensor histidine kinase WalK, partial [Deltaproteobacteria bacterium]|nr:cell wall metabolism sensor histidine kinase WalK [Deltaproteobacteria bacterium]
MKITLTLVVCLTLIFGLLSWYLIERRKQALEEELFAKGRMAALVGAQIFSRYLEEIVEGGNLTQEGIFDENYQLITKGPLSGAGIPKYHTAYDRYFDAHIQEIEDTFLSDAMVVYAVLVDRNGYLPTHNRRYSKPLTGDPDIDRVGNRTKRIFNDPVGLAAARYRGGGADPVLKQIYPRDTGVRMWDLSAPVFVKGKHWGAFRIGFSMNETEVSVQHLRQTIHFASFGALVACALLVMVLVSRYTRPLKDLTRSVQAIADGHYQEKISLQSSDEIGVLVEAFNQMSETLEQTTVSRDFYDNLVQSMHDLLIVVDPGGTVVSINRA